MQATKISCSVRTDHGKGASRRLRAEGKLPAVTYGSGFEATALVISPTELYDVLTSERGRNSVVELDVDGKTVYAMISDYQYHPLTRKLLHADLFQVSEDQKVEVKVPLTLQGKAKGIVMGGKLTQVFRELPLSCSPANIPVGLSHDITELGLEGHISISDIVVPEGAEILLPAKRTVATIAVDRRAKAEEEKEAAADPKAKAEAAK